MDLDYYRTKRRVIKIAIDAKHDEWMLHCSQDDFCLETAHVMSRTIDDLYEQLKQCNRDIDRVKAEMAAKVWKSLEVQR